MRNLPTNGVDLGNKVMQVSLVNQRDKEILNKELTRTKFLSFWQNKKHIIQFLLCRDNIPNQ
jgi:hypothetical protein